MYFAHGELFEKFTLVDTSETVSEIVQMFEYESINEIGKNKNSVACA